MSPVWNTLINLETLNELGPGQPVETRRTPLEALDTTAATFGAPVKSVPFAECCLAALWLRNGFLDESHRISQRIETVEGSWWHGILHRREPDAGNASYWFHRVGRPSLFDAMTVECHRLLAPEQHLPQDLEALRRDPWDPFRFIGACEAHRDTRSPAEMLCRRLQETEWQLLFHHCWQRALMAERGNN